MSATLQTPLANRAIVLRTRGRRHGPIARPISPSDVGEHIKQFVFLDLFDISAMGAPDFGWHPHDLVLGRHSMHTTPAALHAGESEIQRIGNQLASAGLLR